MSDTENKFNEELEDEIGKELDSDDLGSDAIDDFTVKVHREDYVVKRRFYDKDKALETADSLRLDKENLVEDNIDGEIIASELDDEGDEKVDWNKLVDSGLEFYPPIADAAEKKPGEKPVGLTKLAELAKTAGLNEDDNQKAIEKTMVVKKVPTSTKEDEKGSEKETASGSSPEPSTHQDVESSDGKPEAIFAKPEKTLETGTRKSKYIFVGLVFVIAAILFYIFMKPVDTKQTIAKAPESKKTAISRPSEPDVSVEHEKTPVVAEEVAASDGKVPLHIVSEEPVEKQVDSVEDVVKKEAIVVDKSIKKEPPVAKPVPVVEEHYPYTVHVSSYMNLQKTIVAVSSIKKKGFEPFTGLVSIPGKGNWYRIYIGYNRTYKEAVNAAAKVKQKLREDASAAKAIWAIQVGNTDTEAELTGLVNNLGEKGYYFCKIPVAKDSDVIRLLAGAYKTEQETVSMVNALKKDGFEPFVVKR